MVQLLKLQEFILYLWVIAHTKYIKIMHTMWIFLGNFIILILYSVIALYVHKTIIELCLTASFNLYIYWFKEEGRKKAIETQYLKAFPDLSPSWQPTKCWRIEPAFLWMIKPEPPVSYTHLTLPTNMHVCRSRWSPYH